MKTFYQQNGTYNSASNYEFGVHVLIGIGSIKQFTQKYGTMGNGIFMTGEN